MVFEDWKGVQEKERKRKWTSSQKKAKIQVSARRKTNIRDLKKKKGNPNQR